MEDNNIEIRLAANNSELDRHASELIEILSVNNFQLRKKTRIYPNQYLSTSRIYLFFIKKDSIL